ncbi:MAG TPA: hypothetical protein VF885_25175 [Arthrobacter sp.]
MPKTAPSRLSAATVSLLAVLACASALTGCTAAPAASTGPDPKASCAKFEAATKDFIDQLDSPADGPADQPLTYMNEAAAFATGDIQQKMGDAILRLPPTPADLMAPGARAEVKAVNKALGAVAESCKAAGAEVAMHKIPES